MPRQQLLCLRLHVALIQPLEESGALHKLASQMDVAGDIERLDKGEVLVDDFDAETAGVDRVVDFDGGVVDEDLAFVGAGNAGEDVDQGGLAGAVGADKSDDFTREDGQ